MKMDVTELGPMKRALKIEVPADEVTQRLAKAYVELNRQVNIPGFRPGKAPLAMLEKRYAKTVEEDVIRGLVPDFYDKAIRQAGIVPVHVEIPPLDRAKIKKDEPFIFTATVEIRPKIELRDYKAPSPISLKPDNRTVTDEQLDRGLEVLREQQARLEAVTGWPYHRRRGLHRAGCTGHARWSTAGRNQERRPTPQGWITRVCPGFGN